MKKRLISLALMLCMLLPLLPAGVFAAEIVDRGSCGNNVTYTLDSDGVLIISGNGPMKNYSSSAAPWEGQATCVQIEAGVTSIGDGAFRECHDLTDVSIPNSVTSIGRSAFFFCTGLISVTIPNSVTSIGVNAFYYCTGLTSVTIPDSVTSIGVNAFYHCTGLTSVTIPDSVTSIGESAFESCKKLTSITISDHMTGIPNRMLCYCSSLTSVIIPDSVMTIGSEAFSNCSGLTNMVIPTSVTDIGYRAFSYCSGLTSVTIPVSVTSIGEYAFSNCNGLTDVIIPDSVVSMGNGAFYSCLALKSIQISSNLKTINGYTFVGCRELAAVTIPDGVTTIGESAFLGCSVLADITIPDRVNSIGDSAFSCCYLLTELHLPDDLTSLGKDAFSGSGLERVTIPDGVTDINFRTFGNCRTLESVTLPDGLTSIGDYAFSNCVALTGLTIPAGVTSIGNYAFSGCRGLTGMVIPAGVTSIGNLAFDCCTELTYVTIPEGVTSIGNSAFYSCFGLTEVTIPNSVTKIGSNAFYNCSSLTEVTLSDELTEIGVNTFNGCKKLTSVIIPNYVTKIGHGAFQNCSALATVVIPAGVTSIDTSAFASCSSLKRVCFLGSKAKWKQISIGDYNQWLTQATILYGNSDGSVAPAGSVYDAATATLTVTVLENEKGSERKEDLYRASKEATVRYGKTDENGSCPIRNFDKLTTATISKEGYASITRTAEQLKAQPTIYLEPTDADRPTVTAVWLNGTDVRHFEVKLDLLEKDEVVLTADVVWPAGVTGTIKLIQGSRSMTFEGNTLTAVLKDRFDVSKAIYIWAGDDNGHETLKKLKIKESTAASLAAQDGMALNLGNKISFTLPDSFPLIGGWNMGVGIYSNFPVTIEVEDGKIYAAIGFQKDYKNNGDGWSPKEATKSLKALWEKDQDKAADAVEKYRNDQEMRRKLHSAAAKGDGELLGKAGFSVLGFAEGYVDKDGNPHWLDTGMILSVYAGASYSVPLYFGVVPGFFETSFSGSVKTLLNMFIEEDAKGFTPNGVISGTLKLSGGLGVGVKDILSASVGLEGKLVPKWELYSDVPNHFKLDGGLYGYANVELLSFEMDRKTFAIAECTLYEYPEPSELRSLGLDSTELYNIDNYRLKSESEMTDSSAFLANTSILPFVAEEDKRTAMPFISDIYSQAKPQLAAFSDGTLLAVWTGLDNTRAVYDRPRLYYAVKNGSVWSVPRPVNPGGTTMESEPSLAVINDTAYLTWCIADKAMGDAPTIETMTASLDIAAAEFDRDAGNWAISRLTNNDGRMDVMPVVGGIDRAVVVWQRNSMNDIFGLEGTDAISYAVPDGEGWTVFTDAYITTGKVISLDAGTGKTGAVIVWSQSDTDGSASVWKNGVRCGTGSGARIHEEDLYWYREGKLIKNDVDTGVVLASDSFQIEDHTLLYLVNDGMNTALTACYYDIKSKKWSDTVTLSDTDMYIGSFSTAKSGGVLYTLFSATNVVEEAEGGFSRGDKTDLLLLSSQKSCDLTLSRPWYSEETYAPGSTMYFYMDVTNNGTVPVHYAITAEGSDRYDMISEKPLLPGCTAEVTVAYTMGETLDQSLTFTLIALDGEDMNEADNTFSVDLSYEDVVVEGIGNCMTGGDDHLVYANIVNRGYSSQRNITVKLLAHGTDVPEQSVVIDAIEPFDSAFVQFKVPAPNTQACYQIEVVHLDADMNYANDSDFTICFAEETIVKLRSAEGKQVEVSLQGAPAGSLFIAAYQSNKMVSVGTISLRAGTADAVIEMNAALSESCALKAFLIDPDTKEPLMDAILLN